MRTRPLAERTDRESNRQRDTVSAGASTVGLLRRCACLRAAARSRSGTYETGALLSFPGRRGQGQRSGQILVQQHGRTVPRGRRRRPELRHPQPLPPQTGHHPKGAIAFKPPPEVAVTRLLDVDWTPGKTGS
jgi:hypothetical protein